MQGGARSNNDRMMHIRMSQQHSDVHSLTLVFTLQLEGFKSSGGPDEKKDEVTHIGMFRRQLAKSFGHLRSRSNTGPAADPSAAGERSQNDLSSDASSAGIYRDASAQNLAEGPVTDSNLATGPNPGATAAKLKVGMAGLSTCAKACGSTT